MAFTTTRTLKIALSASACAALFSTTALAGGFINSSQSTVFNGTAYAGAAAPGSSSPATMFLNPATLTGFTRITIDSNYTFGVPVTKTTGSVSGTSALTNGQAAVLNATSPRTTGDAGLDYFVPATYIVVPFTDRIVAGLAINSPYGNTNKTSDPNWVGRAHFSTTKLRTITATPSIAYKVNDWLSLGVGMQIQYFSARQVVAGGSGITKGDGVGFGFTAGATITPVKGTQIGLGWRSFIDQPVEGTTLAGGLLSNTNTKGTFNLPNRVNLSLRQTVTEQFDVLASAEWQNWARIGSVGLTNSVIGNSLPYNYKDGWFFSLGGEYKVTSALTLRAGAGYEISPVTDRVRTISTPDNDRIWLSAGASYEVMDRLTINASYSHLFIKNANIRQVTSTGLVFTGQTRSHADLFSIGLTSRWGDAPKKEAPLVRKF
jgi:long-chain fatty acid transport protein